MTPIQNTDPEKAFEEHAADHNLDASSTTKRVLLLAKVLGLESIDGRPTLRQWRDGILGLNDYVQAQKNDEDGQAQTGTLAV